MLQFTEKQKDLEEKIKEKISNIKPEELLKYDELGPSIIGICSLYLAAASRLTDSDIENLLSTLDTITRIVNDYE